MNNNRKCIIRIARTTVTINGSRSQNNLKNGYSFTADPLEFWCLQSCWCVVLLQMDFFVAASIPRECP